MGSSNSAGAWIGLILFTVICFIFYKVFRAFWNSNPRYPTEIDRALGIQPPKKYVDNVLFEITLNQIGIFPWLKDLVSADFGRKMSFDEFFSLVKRISNNAIEIKNVRTFVLNTLVEDKSFVQEISNEAEDTFKYHIKSLKKRGVNYKKATDKQQESLINEYVKNLMLSKVEIVIKAD